MRRSIVLLLAVAAFSAEEKSATEARLSDADVWQLKYMQERQRSARQSLALAQQAMIEARNEIAQVEQESQSLIEKHCQAARIPIKECRLNVQAGKVMRVESPK